MENKNIFKHSTSWSTHYVYRLLYSFQNLHFLPHLIFTTYIIILSNHVRKLILTEVKWRRQLAIICKTGPEPRFRAWFVSWLICLLSASGNTLPVISSKSWDWFATNFTLLGNEHCWPLLALLQGCKLWSGKLRRLAHIERILTWCRATQVYVWTVQKQWWLLRISCTSIHWFLFYHVWRSPSWPFMTKAMKVFFINLHSEECCI